MIEVEEEVFSKELSNAYAIALKEKSSNLNYAIIIGLYKNPLKYDNEDPEYIKEFGDIVAVDEKNNIFRSDGVFRLEDISKDTLDFKNPIVSLKLFSVKNKKDLSNYVKTVKEEDVILATSYIEKKKAKNKFKRKRTK